MHYEITNPNLLQKYILKQKKQQRTQIPIRNAKNTNDRKMTRTIQNKDKTQRQKPKPDKIMRSEPKTRNPRTKQTKRNYKPDHLRPKNATIENQNLASQAIINLRKGKV